MKLKTFTPETCPVQRSGDPFIHCNSKTGLININKFFCEKTGLTAKSIIQFLQDEETEGNWYLAIVNKKESGFELRHNDNTGKGLFLNNTSLVRKIFESIAFEHNSGRILLGESVSVKGHGDLWTLVTASLRNK